MESESAPAGSAADSDGPGPAQRPSELVGFKVRSHGHGLMRTRAGKPKSARMTSGIRVVPARPGNPQFPFPRFPISPGNGEGIPDSRLGRNREAGNPRFPMNSARAGNGNRGPDSAGRHAGEPGLSKRDGPPGTAGSPGPSPLMSARLTRGAPRARVLDPLQDSESPSELLVGSEAGACLPL